MTKLLSRRQEHRIDDLCVQAFGYLQMADFHRAEAVARKAVHLHPDQARAQGLLALALRGLGRVGEAEESARKALELAPDRADMQFTLGLCLWSAGDPDEARRLFEQALARSPDRSDMRMDYAGFLLHQQLFDEARLEAEKVRDLAPDHPKLPLLLACADEQGWRPEIDVLAFRPPLPLPEDRPETYLRLGLAQVDVGNFDLALEEFSRALDLDPEHDEARVLYVTSFLMRKNSYYCWARNWRRGLSRPRVLFLSLLPLLVLGGSGGYFAFVGADTLGAFCASMALMYLLYAVHLLLRVSQPLTIRDFETLVHSRNLTAQGRRKTSDQMAKQIDEVEAVPERGRRGAAAADRASTVIPRQTGTGQDVTRVRRQLEERSRTLGSYSNSFFTLCMVSLLALAWAVVRKNTPGLLVTDMVLLAERASGALTIVFAAGAIYFRTRAREMQSRL